MSNITVENRSYSSSSDINNIGEDEEEEDFQQHHQQQQLQNDHEVMIIIHGGCCSNSDEPSTTTTNSSSSKPVPPAAKKKRNLPGTPDPSADVIALSPTTLMATNRFICEICNKGFKRDQNLQLHRRGHNLPWKLKLRQRTNNDQMIRKRVYVCPEPTCIHHNPARALGDLTGIKKHFSRKHGEKIWKCDKCSKKYAVASDWKAHSKTCGTRDYKCDCGIIFSRRDSFISHRAFCDALAEGTNKLPNQESLIMAAALLDDQGNLEDQISEFISNNTDHDHDDDDLIIKNDPMKSLPNNDLMSMPLKPLNMVGSMFSNSSSTTLFNGGGGGGTISSSFKNCIMSDGITPIITESAHMSATALLQKVAQMGATASCNNLNNSSVNIDQKSSFIISSSAMAGGIDDIAGGGGGGGGGLFMTNQFLQDPNHHQIPSHFFNTSSADAESSLGMNDVGMFSGILMDGTDHQNNQFLKNIEQNDQHSNSSTSMLLMQGRTINSGIGMKRASSGIRNPIGPSRFRNSNGNTCGSGDVTTTLDFLGIGGSKSLNVHESNHHHQQQQQQ